ncbi:MAG: hypothetical protein A2270_05705 [Elusimicrobia bacterium RIFOXYA12_FULL_51_18]|nr:MAG: hypothetical protein A2270_05705 [Elusimicrobia bacterium RIFOXYA12_FULL_51_18]OGS33127.1 MAG: hypothetical protein A2218_06725 [Elusimicrobia bacterium RIFOXYA2_FULL_53_38]
MKDKSTSAIKIIGALSLALLWTVAARLPAQAAPPASNRGITVLREFAPVQKSADPTSRDKEFGIKMVNVVRLDPKFLRFETVSAQRLAKKTTMTVRDAADKLAAENPVAIINASFFDTKPFEEYPMGEFVENGDRPRNIIPVYGKHFDRIFVVYKNGSVDVLDGIEEFNAKQLGKVDPPVKNPVVYAVAGRSMWEGHSGLTNRSAVCIDETGGVLLAAVYPLKTLPEIFAYMESLGCLREKTVSLDGGGSTQMFFSGGDTEWELGWERKGGGDDVPECHLKGGNKNKLCYRSVATFIAAFRK